MIAYFDTSGFVPLLIDEPASAQFAHLWSKADKVFATRLLFVEATAALARARHASRISSTRHARAVRQRDELWHASHVVELDYQLMTRAAAIANTFRLRGYDSVHCAAAESIASNELIAASADRAMLSVWGELGLSTYNPAVP